MEYVATAIMVMLRSARDIAFGVKKPDVPRRRCAFLTDVEGNYEYFERYVDISEVVEWTDKLKKNELKFKDDHSYFVFGGDSQDKGIGDIRFVKIMLQFKQKYGERVHFIIGNRDANKLRLTTELSVDALKSKDVADDATFPYWIAQGKVVTPNKFLTTKGFDDNGPNRLRWILNETMGADGAFERRKKELAIIRSKEVDQISEEEVFESYKEEADPASENNFMLQYLEKAELIYRFNNVLFVHGAVSKVNVGTVPGLIAQSKDVTTWVNELNAWKQYQINAFKARPYQGLNTKDRAGHGLMDYGVPNGNDKKTVVYDTNLLAGNPNPLDRAVKEYLAESKINTVMCGHVPHGDCPAVINCGGIRVITADTSYSKMGNVDKWGIVDNRGDAVSEVIVWEDGRVHVHGKLSDKRPIDYHLHLPGKVSPFPVDDKYIGRELKNNFWVKAKLKGDNKYVICKGEGFKLTVEDKTEQELLDIGFVDEKKPAPECQVKLTVIRLREGDNFASAMDKTDPFVKIFLHKDDDFLPLAEAGGEGGVFQTEVKDNAGGEADFGDSFKFDKPAGICMLRFELWDKNSLSPDEILGFKDVDLDLVWDEHQGKTTTMDVHTFKASNKHQCGDTAQYGYMTGILEIEISLTEHLIADYTSFRR